MLAKLALAIARRLDDETLRGLVDRVFVRTRRALESSSADPNAAQWVRLQQILADNADTEVGRTYRFADIRDFDAYRARVPVSTWDDAAPLVDRMIAGEKNVLVADDPFFFATTSGTTGRRKLIPVTAAFVEECRATNKLLYRQTLKDMPQLLKGKRLGMRSPKVEQLAPGKQAGSITVALGGFADEDGLFDAVPADVFLIEDFDQRYQLALRFALQERITVAAAVNPSTLFLYAKTLADHGEQLAAAVESGGLGVDVPGERGDRLRARARKDPAAARRVRDSAARHGRARMRDVFPDLAGLVCWKGGSAPWYLDKLTASYGTLPVLDYGYCASEGCFGAPVSIDSASSVLVPHAHVIELAPLDQIDAVRAGTASTVLLGDAQVGQLYVPIVTTGAGLYRYDMNDVVEVTGKHGDTKNGAPLVVFRHKAGAMASITGEKVGESHVVAAAARAQVPGDGFVCAPLLPPGDALPQWLIAIDPGAHPMDATLLAAVALRFDDALKKENLEYDAKRGSLRLQQAQAALLPALAIARHRAARVAAGAPDAHVKVPHVSPDGRLLLDLGLEQTAAEFAAWLPIKAGQR